MSKQKQLNKTALYMRLSRDDEKAGESMSIDNQRIILRKYIADNGGAVVDEYIDDGWSGTDFERPAVKRLLDDAKDGKIDTIVVKDLSRFGRNYIQVGQYIDYIFPAYGIRFVALNDNVDTADRSGAGIRSARLSHHERVQRMARGEHEQEDTRRIGSQMAGGQIHELGLPLRLQGGQG